MHCIGLQEFFDICRWRLLIYAVEVLQKFFCATDLYSVVSVFGGLPLLRFFIYENNIIRFRRDYYDTFMSFSRFVVGYYAVNCVVLKLLLSAKL